MPAALLEHDHGVLLPGFHPSPSSSTILFLSSSQLLARLSPVLVDKCACVCAGAGWMCVVTIGLISLILHNPVGWWCKASLRAAQANTSQEKRRGGRLTVCDRPRVELALRATDARAHVVFK